MAIRIHIDRLVVDEGVCPNATPEELSHRVTTGVQDRLTASTNSGTELRAEHVSRAVSETMRCDLR